VQRESSEWLAELERELAEKDQLVVALTERLEQAAEQLDRQRRTGGEGGGRESRRGSPLPSDLIEDHKSLVEELREVVHQWQDMQAAASVGRLEGQIAELRDLLTNQMFAAPAPSSAGPAEPASLAAALSKLGAQVAEARSADTPRPGSWEARKAALLAAEGAAEIDSAADSGTAGASAALDANGLRESDLPPLPEPPAPWDPAQSGAGSLREALVERDAYIKLLTQHLQTIHSIERLPIEIAGLEDLPPALKQRVEEWETQLQTKHRRAEIELSLERARLSRDQTHLRQQQEQIVKELRRLGLESRAETASEPALADDDSQGQKSGTRWLRFLGVGKRDDNEPEKG
jgi:hypothetical protein